MSIETKSSEVMIWQLRQYRMWSLWDEGIQKDEAEPVAETYWTSWGETRGWLEFA